MIIYTGRFQPFHNGHLSLIKYLRNNYPEQTICIAIIKDVSIKSQKSMFDQLTDQQLIKSKNPFDSEIVLKLICSVLQQEHLPNVVTTLMPRASLETWSAICALFDCQRTWAFTQNTLQQDVWEQNKIAFYESLGESTITVPIQKSISGTDIRTAIANSDFKMLSELVPPQVLEHLKSAHF